MAELPDGAPRMAGDSCLLGELHVWLDMFLVGWIEAATGTQYADDQRIAGPDYD